MPQIQPSKMPIAGLLSRPAAVEAILRWVSTPYRLGGRVRGAGADCCTLLVEYLIEIGKIRAEDMATLPLYSPDWFLHASSERYLKGLMRFGTMVSGQICRGRNVGAQPGDIVLFKVVGSRLFNHGAVVTAWPRGVHAQADGVRQVDLVSCPLTSFRSMEIFDPWGNG
jgi:cell wall-associated NlpC family hydrolase